MAGSFFTFPSGSEGLLIPGAPEWVVHGSNPRVLDFFSSVSKMQGAGRRPVLLVAGKGAEARLTGHNPSEPGEEDSGLIFVDRPVACYILPAHAIPNSNHHRCSLEVRGPLYL